MDPKIANKAIAAFLKPLVRASAQRTSLPVTVEQTTSATVISVQTLGGLTRRIEVQALPFQAFPKIGAQFASTVLACLEASMPVELECCEGALLRVECACEGKTRALASEVFATPSVDVSADVMRKALLFAGGNATRPQLNALFFHTKGLDATNGNCLFRFASDYGAINGAALPIVEAELACALAKVCKADTLTVGNAGKLTHANFTKNGVQFDSVSPWEERQPDFNHAFGAAMRAPVRYQTLSTQPLRGFAKQAKAAALAKGNYEKRTVALAFFTAAGLEFRIGSKKEWAKTSLHARLSGFCAAVPSEPVSGIDAAYLEAAAEAFDFGDCSLSQTEPEAPFVFVQGDRTVLVGAIRV